jgi:hypothetical protein
MDNSQAEARPEARGDGSVLADARADEVSPARVQLLRSIVQRCLDGDEEVDHEVEGLAVSIADAARASGQTPERLLIGVRALWRELALSQGDRLQVSGVYDALVRSCIERYYGELGRGSDAAGARAPKRLAD